MLKNFRGFAHPILLVILSIVVLGTGYFTYTRIKHSQAVNKEKQLYATLDKQSTDYINAIAAKYPGKISHERYCEYISVKLGKSAPVCRVDSTLDLLEEHSPQAILNDLALTYKTSTWDYENTFINNQNKLSKEFYGSINFIRKDTKNCRADIYRGIELKVVIGCYGNALAEHYPVREH